MGKIVKLKNANDVYTYPVTKTEAVYLEDNKTTLKDYLDAMAITKTAGPAQVVTFDDGANNVPVKSLILNIEPHQEGTGDPSPDNVRPITGYSAIAVTKAGKNLLNTTLSSQTSHGVTVTKNTDGTYSTSGTVTTAVAFNLTTEVELPSGSYILSGCPTGGSSTTYYLEINQIGGSQYFKDIGLGTTVEIQKGSTYRVRINAKDGVNMQGLVFKPMLRLASNTDKTYEPCLSQTYQVSIPSEAGTVYSGTLDVGKGILTIDRGLFTFDGSTGVSKSALTALDIFLINSASLGYSILDGKVILNEFHFVNATTTQNIGEAWIGTSATQLRVGYSSYGTTTLDEFKAWLAENPLQMVASLATPITYNLTPIEIATLLGGNTIWMDVDGTLQVVYKADLATYIANAISSNSN